jgi:hypothetical protein
MTVKPLALRGRYDSHFYLHPEPLSTQNLKKTWIMRNYFVMYYLILSNFPCPVSGVHYKEYRLKKILF